jgi:hypothetical protein
MEGPTRVTAPGIRACVLAALYGLLPVKLTTPGRRIRSRISDTELPLQRWRGWSRRGVRVSAVFVDRSVSDEGANRLRSLSSVKRDDLNVVHWGLHPRRSCAIPACGRQPRRRNWPKLSGRMAVARLEPRFVAEIGAWCRRSPLLRSQYCRPGRCGGVVTDGPPVVGHVCASALGTMFWLPRNMLSGS